MDDASWFPWVNGVLLNESAAFGIQLSYEGSPATARERSTWLSHGDAVRAFVAAMHTQEHFAVFYAVSANTDGWWDRAAGERVGYFPSDNAAGRGISGGAPELQGGEFATPAYSLDRMRG